MTEQKAARLSEVIQASKRPNIYLRDFYRAAERNELGQVFVIAEQFNLKPSKKGTKAKAVQDYLILDDAQFSKWHHKQLNTETAPAGLPSIEDILSGKISPEDAEKITREFHEKRRKRIEQSAASMRRKKESQQQKDTNS